MKTLKIIVSGNVQGITFRQFVKDNADRLGVRGLVRNLENGNVEVFAEGKEEIVKELLMLCRQGPKHSTVKNVEVNEIKHQGFEGFKISRL